MVSPIGNNLKFKEGKIVLFSKAINSEEEK